MAKKRKTKTSKPRESLSPEQQAGLEAWLQGIGQGAEEALISLTERAGTDPDLALAMIQGLGRSESPEAGWLANRAAQVLASKALRKEAKKSLYRLEQKGLQVREEDSSRPIFRAVKLEPPFGYLSGYYPDHSQVLSLAFPMGGGEGYCGAAICHFEKGFLEVGMSPLRLAQFRKMNEQMQGDLPWPQVRLEDGDLVWVLDAVLKRHRAAGGESGQETMFLAQWVEEQGGAPEPGYLLRRMGLEPEPRPGYGPELAELLDRPPCLTWYPDEERWNSVREKEPQEGGSGLILSPDLAAEQEEKALAGVSAELFPRESYPAWKIRLEETALFLYLNGQAEQARIFAAAAEDLDRPDHPLFISLIKKTKKLELETAELGQDGLAEPVGGSGLILPPGLDKAE